MPLDILSLPPTLKTLDDVPAELREFYSFDDDCDVFALTDTARENITKVAAGISQLAAQRDQATLEKQILDAVLVSGAAGPLAKGAAALFASEHRVTIRDGQAIVQTDGGEFALRDAIAEFMQGEGSAFLPERPAESDDFFTRQMRKRG
jgi:hypothetical protein